MTEYTPRLVGGDPSLDFLNTIHDWTVEEHRDAIPTFEAALRFGEEAGLLTRNEGRSLAARAPGNEIRRLHDLRALLERVFRAVVSAEDPTRKDLDELGRAAAGAAHASRLHPGQAGGIVRAVDAEAGGVSLLRWRVVDAAVELLTTADPARLKACPRCGWFFLDSSRNRSRRWCSMEDCGNAVKARRYYRRKQAK